jgi:hypothetical protein
MTLSSDICYSFYLHYETLETVMSIVSYICTIALILRYTHFTYFIVHTWVVTDLSVVILPFSYVPFSHRNLSFTTTVSFTSSHQINHSVMFVYSNNFMWNVWFRICGRIMRGICIRNPPLRWISVMIGVRTSIRTLVLCIYNAMSY